ncbi:MAG: DUF4880 domain-containing protein [Pseudomonadota bacterium]
MGSPDTADAEARAWIARLKSGEATEEDAASFTAWRERSAENERAFRHALRLWNLSAQAVQRPALSRRRLLLGGGGLAAASLGAQQAAVFLGFARSLEAWSADLSTSTGSTEPFEFSEATGALDGASAVEFRGASGIRLLQGAVFLRSTGEASQRRSISLKADGLEASFSVGAAEIRIGDRGPEVACAEGEVNILAPEPRTLEAGATVMVDRAGQMIAGRRSPDEIASWRRGILTFRKRRLGDVLSVLNRHRTGNVLLRDAALAELLVSGVFHLDRPDEVVSHLATSLALERYDLPVRIVLLG